MLSFASFWSVFLRILYWNVNMISPYHPQTFCHLPVAMKTITMKIQGGMWKDEERWGKRTVKPLNGAPRPFVSIIWPAFALLNHVSTTRDSKCRNSYMNVVFKKSFQGILQWLQHSDREKWDGRRTAVRTWGARSNF